MKYKYILTCLVVAFTLSGSIKATAQHECPDIEWMRFFNNDQVFGLLISQIDSSGNTLGVGRYMGSPVLGTYQFPTSNNFMTNIFIGKLDSTGNPLWIRVAKTFTYGDDNSITFPVVVDASGDIHAVVNFRWKTEFAGTTYTSTNSQQNNALLVKMDQQGQVLSTHLFENMFVFPFHIDSNSNFYCYATIMDSITIDNHTYFSNGGRDLLIFKLDDQLHLVWAKEISGANDEVWVGGTADSQNNLYITGLFNSPNLTLGNTQLSNPFSGIGQNDIFIAKINSNGVFQWATQAGCQSSTSCSATDIALDDDNNIYISGSLKGTLNLNGNPAASFPLNKDNSFLIKYTPLTDKFSSMLLKGGANRGLDLLYLPNKNMMVLGGSILHNDSVDFYIENITANNTDFYVLGVDLTGFEKMTPQWVVHSHGGGSEGSPSLAKDFEDNIYLSGGYYDDSGAGALGALYLPYNTWG